MRVVSRLSTGVSGGRIVGSRLGQHRLAGAGAADHQNVVAAGGRDHQRSLGELLAAHVGEIHVVAVEAIERSSPRRPTTGSAGKPAGQHADRLGEGADAIDVRRPRRRRPRGRSAAGTSMRLTPAGRGGHRHRQRALDRPDAAVEGQLADGGAVLQLFRQELPSGDQHAQRDRQVEAAGVFTEVGGG